MANTKLLTRAGGALLAIGLVIGIGLAVFNTPPSPAKKPPASPPPATAAATGATGAPGASVQPTAPVTPTGAPGAPSAGATGAAAAPPATTPAATTAAPPASPATAATASSNGAPIGVLSMKRFTADPATANFAPLGSLSTPGVEMEVRFSPIGAGVEAITMANQFDSIGQNRKPMVVQAPAQVGPRVLMPMSALAVEIDGQVLSLSDPVRRDLWRQVAPGVFEAEVVDESGATVLTLRRAYALAGAGRFDVTIEQTVRNHGGRALGVRWFQIGPVDLVMGVKSYGGDVRRFRAGYIPESSPDGQTVLAERYLKSHMEVVGSPNAQNVLPDVALWPTPDTAANRDVLAFAAFTNRYYAVALMGEPTRQAKRADGLPDKSWRAAGLIDRVVLPVFDASGAFDVDHSVAAMRITTVPTRVDAGQTLDLSMRLYAGPISARTLAGAPELAAMGLPGLRLYTFGGPCGCCTFQTVAYLLHWFLGVLHDYLVFDWAIAIIVLVLCVKTILHPITYWSQSKITRFGKQMAAVAPKIQKLKERYAGDPKKFREEQMKLMREEQVDYGGALGCLPMFLQTPIWIALYAMIFFTFELRHEGAFFGVFQWVTGGAWGFMGDLAEPDRFIPLPFSFHVPLLSGLIGPIDAINLLPLLLGAVFYIQQKYLTPPTQPGSMTPEQETTQKIMKVMIVVMFPLFMYNAPCALSIYFICNSTIGIIESRRIRAAVTREDEAREALKKAGGPAGRAGAEPARKGFFLRMQDEIERRQKVQEAKRQQQERERRKNKDQG